MYTICCGSASLVFKKIYKSSYKHETLLIEMALVPFPVSEFRRFHVL